MIVSRWKVCAAPLLVVVVAALTGHSAGATDTAGRIDAYVKPLVAAGHFSGCILAVRDSEVVYERAFGLANREHRMRNTIDTRFCVASVTKSMTRSLAVLLLTEKKLGLQDSLTKFVPDFPRGDEITVDMLIRHRSGIPHRVTSDDEKGQPYTTADMVEKAKQAPLAFPPGERRLYSSAGYSVLARVLEISTGSTFPALLERYIFQPAGMTQTVGYDDERKIPRRAHEYLLEESGVVPAPEMDYSFLVGAGSLFSTVHDVRRFCEAVLDTVYGQGVMLSISQNGAMSTNGNTNGYRCFAVFDRPKGYGLVVAANLESGANDLLRRDLPLLVQGQEVAAPDVPKPTRVPVETTRLNDYVGTYDMGGSEFEVLVKDGDLFAGRFRLMPVGVDRFFSFASYAEISFTRDKQGDRVNGLTWAGPGGRSEWTRMEAPADAGNDEARAATELGIFRAWLDRNYPEYHCDEGPAEFGNAAIAAAYPGQRFYYVLTYTRGIAPPFGNALSLVARVDDDGEVYPIRTVESLREGLKSVSTASEAREAASAVLILSVAGERRWAFEPELFKVRQNRNGWLCSYAHDRSYVSRVQFDRDGSLATVECSPPPVP